MSDEHFEDRVRKHLSLIRPHLDRIPRAYQMPNITLDEADRLADLVAAVREMLKFGEHEGPCTNHDDASGTESCLLHVEAFNTRRDALTAALAALDEASHG